MHSIYDKLLGAVLLVVIVAVAIDGRGVKRDVESVDTMDEGLEDTADEPDRDDDSLRPTNVIIRENYVDCVNINSDVDKLWANFQVISNESCLTLYRFAAFEITYDVLFKNGATAQTLIHLELQDSERTNDTIAVTLTGKVVSGYLMGAHFQSVTVYPVLSDHHCLTEPGITSLRSNSASVTFILLPSSQSPAAAAAEDSTAANELRVRSESRATEAFDCFGSASIEYSPGLVDFKHLNDDSPDV